MNRTGLRKYLTDRNISLIIRWWAAGAVYFFIGWGTALGNQTNIIDFVFSLGLVMGIFNMLIVNPSLRMALNLSPERRPTTYAISQRISDYLVEIINSIFIVYIVALIYIGGNRLINILFDLPAATIKLPGEPIMFGVFYVLVRELLRVVIQRIKHATIKSKGAE